MNIDLSVILKQLMDESHTCLEEYVMIDPSLRKSACTLKQNKRYAPLLGTGLKLGALLIPISGVVGLWLWTIYRGRDAELSMQD